MDISYKWMPEVRAELDGSFRPQWRACAARPYMCEDGGEDCEYTFLRDETLHASFEEAAKDAVAIADRLNVELARVLARDVEQ